MVMFIIIFVIDTNTFLEDEFNTLYGAQNEAYICGNAPRGLEPL